MTTSLPSPPSSMSLPSPPVIVSLPAPPSSVSWMSAARPLPAVMMSSPPLALSDEVLGGADVEAEGRGVDAVEAHARAVGRDGEGLGAVAAVDLGGVDAVAALDEVAVVARVPDHAVVAGLAEHLVVAGAAGQHVVAVAAEQQVVAALAEQRVVAGLAEELVGARAAGRACRCRRRRTGRAAGSAPLVSSSAIVSLPPSPKTWIRPVLATVGVPPTTGTAPPLTRIVPAASRLNVMLLPLSSPSASSRLAARRKLAEIAIVSSFRWWIVCVDCGAAEHVADGCRYALSHMLRSAAAGCR